MIKINECSINKNLLSLNICHYLIVSAVFIKGVTIFNKYIIIKMISNPKLYKQLNPNADIY